VTIVKSDGILPAPLLSAWRTPFWILTKELSFLYSDPEHRATAASTPPTLTAKHTPCERTVYAWLRLGSVPTEHRASNRNAFVTKTAQCCAAVLFCICNVLFRFFLFLSFLLHFHSRNVGCNLFFLFFFRCLYKYDSFFCISHHFHAAWYSNVF